MFNKLSTLKSFNNEIISIDDLFNIVKNNPQRDLINSIRNSEYKSKQYKSLKLKVNCILPHGIFNSIKNNGLVKLSNYLYYDIDGFDTIEGLNDTKNKLINTNFVSFISKSVGARGLSFLIKIEPFEGLNDTFTELYKYVRSILLNLGFNIDLSASGLVRKMIISSDDNVYINNEVSLSIDISSFNKFKQELNSLNKIKIKHTHNRNIHIRANDTSFEVIEFKDLLKQIKVETLYTKEIDGDFIIEEMDYYKIILPKLITDGTKHKLYIRIINALYYINNNINIDQVYSYLYYVNKLAQPNMNEFKLKTLVCNICNNIETTGEIKIKPRVKRIHFNKDSKLTKKQKQNMGAQLAAKIKNNKTLELIEMARIECEKNNETPTQKVIQEKTGLSLSTIKRNWRKEYNDISDLKLIEDVEVDNNVLGANLKEIGEEEFFKKSSDQSELFEK